MARSVCAVALLLLLWWCRACEAQVATPSKLDGFVYKKAALPKEDSIVVEAFFDPLCGDSRDSWPPLKQIIAGHSARISLTVHPFSLPYHHNSFLASHALHIANRLNSSKTYHLLEKFFMIQERYYNAPTLNMTRQSIIKNIAKFTAETLGDGSLFPAVLAGFRDCTSDGATRVSFKYGCSRGISSTPSFIVNGFLLPGAGSPLSYCKWKSIIDPLVRLR